MAPASDFTWESQHGTGGRDTGHSSRESPPTSPGLDGTGNTLDRPFSAVGSPGDNAARSDVRARHGSSVGMPAGHHVRPSTVASAAVGGAETTEREGLRTTDGGEPKSCCLGVDIKRLRSRLPLDQLKILVVVWQILSVFSSITEVDFPESYSKFLSWIDVVNFDIAHIFSASCTFPSVNFYTSLLVTTLTPLALGAVLLLTYHLAKRRAGIGTAGVDARRAALSRHVAAGLFLSFLVFTSTSTLVFKTFACDDTVVEGKSYLRADYSLLCDSGWHNFFKGYAILMVLVYPIGIPAMYAVILWRKRELLNPRIHTAVMPEPEEPSGTSMVVAHSIESAGIVSSVRRVASKAQTGTKLSPQELKELAERVTARRDNPELTPSMFLWKDFGPDLYYYEVLECGRRILLTGVLIFISPDGSTRVAAACIFAFGTLLGFELLRPHLDSTDAWLYRMGCVVIFLSYFLALLIDVDSAGEDGRSALADLLVAINVVLVLVVFLAPWFMARPTPPMKQSAHSSGDEELSLTPGNA